MRHRLPPLSLVVLAALVLPACLTRTVEVHEEQAVAVPAPVEAPEPVGVEPGAPQEPLAPLTLIPDPDDPSAPHALQIDLSEEYGCGWGVYVGTANQQVALIASYVGGDPGERLPLPDATLPDPDWDVRLQLGRDLFSNWCDDVMEPHEPVPQVVQEWAAVSGTLRVTTQPDVTCPTTATIAVVDLIVQRPDGRRVAVPELTLTNRSWGCFAG